MTAKRTLGNVLPLRVPPFLDSDNTEFWTGGKDGRLLIDRCGDCGWWTHPAAPRCRRCRSANVTPQPVSGRGKVATYTINYKEWIPGSEPYIIGVVELEEQPALFITTNLIDVEAEDVTIGMDVTIVFEEARDIWYPLFRPAA